MKVVILVTFTDKILAERNGRNALRDLAEDKGIVIKSADKRSCVAICDREDYLKEADRQLSDNKIYRDAEYSKNILSSIVDKSNKIFQSLFKMKHI